MTTPSPNRVLPIEFLFLDRETCGRCGGTEAALDQAVTAVTPALTALGLRAEVTRTHVTSLEQAERMGFLTSPTIRIGGTDIQPSMPESACGDCTELATGAGTVNCRHWTWKGESHMAAPVGLLVEAILTAAVAAPSAPSEPLAVDAAQAGPMTANLARFFGKSPGMSGAGCGCGCG